MRMLALVLLAALSFSASAQVTNATSTPVPSAAHTESTFNSPDQTNSFFSGGHFAVNITTLVTGTYTIKIQGKDPTSGNYYDILASTALNAIGTTVLKVYPGITAAANASVSDILPPVWRIQLVGASTPSATLSVSALLVR